MSERVACHTIDVFLSLLHPLVLPVISDGGCRVQRYKHTHTHTHTRARTQLNTPPSSPSRSHPAVCVNSTRFSFELRNRIRFCQQLRCSSTRTCSHVRAGTQLDGRRRNSQELSPNNLRLTPTAHVHMLRGTRRCS